MYRSPAYLKWIEQADQIFVMHKKGPIKMLMGPFVAILELHSTDGRKRRDCDNRIKAAIDYAVRLGLVQDDSFMEWVVAGWTDEPPPHGCRLTILQKEGLGSLPALIASLATILREKTEG